MHQFKKVYYWFSLLQSSIGYLPSILTLSAIILAPILLWMDKQYGEQIIQAFPWMYESSAEAARGILSTIATSLITVISISFSIIIVALQQAANSFSPRVLRSFTGDKGNQLVLGMYLATFTYTILVLRTIKTDANQETFIPAVSIMTAMLLTLICLGLLIYFINKMFNSLQAFEIIKRIHDDINNEIDKKYPDEIGRKAKKISSGEVIVAEQKQAKKQYIVRSESAGFINLINNEILASISNTKATWVYIPISVGQFINKNDTLAIVNDYAFGEKHADELRRAIEIHNVRSINEDPLFGFRQLVDIALRAISPGINDPTTAEYAVRYMGNNLQLLAQRQFPENTRTFENNPVLYIFNASTWESYVELAFAQLRRHSMREYRIVEVMIEVMQKILAVSDTPEQKKPIQNQIKLLKEAIRSSNFIKSDKVALLQKMR